MAINRSLDGAPANAAEQQRARVRSEGLVGHPHLAALMSAQGARSTRDLSDAVHLLCALHGRYPGLIAIAARNAGGSPWSDWLAEAEQAFEIERNYLLRLTATVGPLPSTPGAAQTESSLVAARHAIETLGNSERQGCALGAAAALIADWPAVRPVLDRAASRAGLEWPAMQLPSRESLDEAINTASAAPAAARALAFGTEQMLLQHRALFGLLEARAEARGDF